MHIMRGKSRALTKLFAVFYINYRINFTANVKQTNGFGALKDCSTSSPLP